MGAICPKCRGASGSAYVCTACGAALAPAISHPHLPHFATPTAMPGFWLSSDVPPMPDDPRERLRWPAPPDDLTAALVNRLEAQEDLRLRRRKRLLFLSAAAALIAALALLFWTERALPPPRNLPSSGWLP